MNKGKISQKVTHNVLKKILEQMRVSDIYCSWKGYKASQRNIEQYRTFLGLRGLK